MAATAQSLFFRVISPFSPASVSAWQVLSVSLPSFQARKMVSVLYASKEDSTRPSTSLICSSALRLADQSLNQLSFIAARPADLHWAWMLAARTYLANSLLPS